MSATITAQFTITKAGDFRIVAKGGGKQRTSDYSVGQSIESNLFNATAEVAGVLGLPLLPRTETVEVDRGFSRTILG